LTIIYITQEIIFSFISKHLF
jgi:serine/threonine-protein kinase HipA